MATTLAVFSLHILVVAFVQLAAIASDPLPPFNLQWEKNLVGLPSEQSLFVTDNPVPERGSLGTRLKNVVIGNGRT